jgi:ornithine cyclodeaminase/alanine dehydrogenase-like protein (mu-crystallin family)
VRFFTEQQVRELADPQDVTNAIRSAFERGFGAHVRMPARTSMALAGDAVLLVMPCCDTDLNASGVKIVTVSREAGVNASYELRDPRSGLALARMEANYLTDLRTAATSAVATDLLARKDSSTLGIFGTGRQANVHLRLLPYVRRFQRILVNGSGRSDVAAFCRRIAAGLEGGKEIEVVAATAEICARESDVICTCTTSSAPLFRGQWLKPGCHLNLVGAFQPHTREVDTRTVVRSRVFVDTYEGALAEAGELLIPLQERAIIREQICGDLHEVASAKKPGRISDSDITLFKSVGCALEDLVTARLVHERARQES